MRWSKPHLTYPVGHKERIQYPVFADWLLSFCHFLSLFLCSAATENTATSLRKQLESIPLIMTWENALFWSGIFLLASAPLSESFQAIFLGSAGSRAPTALSMAYKTQGRSSPRTGGERSKRQERVGHLVRTELSNIVHKGVIKGDADYLEDGLRQRISIVHVDVSPDLRQARITVSVRKAAPTVDSNPAVDKRRAYSWLVENTKYIRHTLAQNLSYMKSVPQLTFAQADISAAVDVMYLIDKVASGYKRETVGEFGGDDDSLPRGMVGGIDFDEDFDEEEWIDEDFFEEDVASDETTDGDGTVQPLTTEKQK